MEFDPNEYRELLDSIRLTYGYDFTDYNEQSIKRRIVHFMDGRDITTLTKLGQILMKDQYFFEEFLQNLSVTVTEMFRDPAFYKSLRANIIKRLATYPVIKIWIAGCATGEEVYSMAILLKEEGLLHRSIIYATDINQRSLQIAMQGIYPIENMKVYTANYLQAGGEEPFSEYYSAKYNSALFNQTLTQNVVFSAHNLAADKSFNEFQLIMCRNVLMYFNDTLKNRVIDLFYESLCHFGFLGLGDKESLLFSLKKNCFTETDKKQKIYMKVKCL
jgi:chemotaxis protein methyltransferase CheR